jgi:curli production assembly/transport component CsgG
MTRNEPQQLCVNEAIESALVHLIVQGVANQSWSLKDMKDWYDPTMQRYLQENQGYVATMEDVNPPYSPVKVDPPKTLGG